MTPRPGALAGTEIAVPASIGNLGPGFDTIGLALQLYLRVRVAAASDEDPGSLAFDFGSRPIDGENLIERAFRTAAAAAGVRHPGMRLEVRSDIPLQSGLGSSAAAAVAGLRLYEAVAGPLADERLLQLASGIEGHPDNAAASLLGGLTASCQLEDGRVVALSSCWPPSLRLVVATPAVRLPTPAARQVLPPALSRADALFNLQRVVLLLQSLHAGDFRYLREALRDRWHQPYREPLVPGLTEALGLEHPDLLGVCLSGAGPSVAAIAAGSHAAIEALLAGIYAARGIACEIRTLAVHQKGAP